MAVPVEKFIRKLRHAKERLFEGCYSAHHRLIGHLAFDAVSMRSSFLYR